MSKTHNGLTRRQAAGGAIGLLAAAQAGCAWAAPVAAGPKLNQLGYRPKDAKRFVLTVTPGDAAPRAFTVETLTGKRVFTGQLDGKVHDLTATAGEHVRTGDFSALTTQGRYRVKVDEQASAPFGLAEGLYGPLVRDAARAFFLIRASVAIDDPVTGIRHAAGHRDETALTVDGQTRDLTGGWYNAGDYGKWTHMAAISVSQMMWLHELRPAPAAALKLGVPPLYPNLPDLLQQARWGLEWLLKMQNPDGSVLHKVDSGPNVYAWGQPPERDPHPRVVQPGGSLDAGVFVGAMMQAARVFASQDHAFAVRCRAAALRAWTWLEANPKVMRDDVNYADPDPRQEILWATCEMAAVTGDAALGARAAEALKAIGAFPFFWPSPQVLGAMSLARGKGEAAATARAAIVDTAKAVAADVRADPYGFSARPQAYYWGSVEVALNTAVICLFAAELGEPSARDTAQRLADYVLGCNALDHSFVTGHGERATRRPYHWTCRVWGLVMPGWASGGPNGGAPGADPRLKALIDAKTPPAKCFVDACENDGSWASNEGQTSENAALLLATGLLGL
uniref:glycoside hydrolase family 9 protein n=1 Tax=uncultured Caulobacter sp. TaxID=158749 RepID=UPI0025F63A5D|nr:glycoside hydrolase family 9 protein [uncultured Caulobacter sp.]